MSWWWGFAFVVLFAFVVIFLPARGKRGKRR
jgi:hypothetical protein